MWLLGQIMGTTLITELAQFVYNNIISFALCCAYRLKAGLSTGSFETLSVQL